MLQFQVVNVSVEPKDTILISRSANKGLFTDTRFNLVFKQKEEKISQIIKVDGLLEENQIGISSWMMKKLGVRKGSEVILVTQSKSATNSYSLIKQKMIQPGYAYGKAEIDEIISDITKENLTPMESSVFVTSMHYQNWSVNEVEYLTRAMANSGQKINWDNGIIFDKHSLGGVPGNKVSLLIVPIIAAAGLMIPKTSSRAITSPSGTADTMEALGADIEFTIDEIVEITNKTKGLIAWTGGLNIVPADELRLP